MIGKVVRGDDPHGLLRYLLAAHKDLSPGHVDTRHIVDLDLAAEEMAAVIAGAPNRSRIRRPIEHIILAWHRDECPTIDAQKRAAWNLVRKLGLSDNQIVIAVHAEQKSGLIPGPGGRHHEVHIAVNRVRLDGTVAKLDHDYARVEVACAEVAVEMGFAKIPGRFNGGAAALARPGVGNAIGSIAAQRGISNIAEQLRQDAAAMAALRTARQQGWEALLAAFQAHGVVVAVGRGRAKAGLRPGLVLVDAGDEKRRIKISAMDDAAEKWSSVALEKELGPMPAGWEKVFADDGARGENEAKSTPLSLRSHADTTSSIADEIRSDPARMSRLRAARAAGWDALIQEFTAQGLAVEPGRNARRGIETGLVMIDRARPDRREPLSRLDTPTEKWGAGALTGELGPWPGTGRRSDGPSLADAKTGVEERRKPQRPAFDRDAAYRDYLTVKAEAVAHNRALYADLDRRKAALLADQRRDRDRHYALRRLRRELVRGVFGWRSLVGRAINAVADALFADRMRALARAQSARRRALLAEASARRVPVPTWTAQLRAAQVSHAESVRAAERRAADAAWLAWVRERRQRLKGSPEARARLVEARAALDARIEGQFGVTIAYLLDGRHSSTAAVLEDLRDDVTGNSAAARRRLPVIIDRIREKLWLEQVRARRDRLRQGAAAKGRMERRRSRSRFADGARVMDASTDTHAQILPPLVVRDRMPAAPGIPRAGRPTTPLATAKPRLAAVAEAHAGLRRQHRLSELREEQLARFAGVDVDALRRASDEKALPKADQSVGATSQALPMALRAVLAAWAEDDRQALAARRRADERSTDIEAAPARNSSDLLPSSSDRHATSQSAAAPSPRPAEPASQRAVRAAKDVRALLSDSPHRRGTELSSRDTGRVRHDLQSPRVGKDINEKSVDLSAAARAETDPVQRPLKMHKVHEQSSRSRASLPKLERRIVQAVPIKPEAVDTPPVEALTLTATESSDVARQQVARPIPVATVTLPDDLIGGDGRDVLATSVRAAAPSGAEHGPPGARPAARPPHGPASSPSGDHAPAGARAGAAVRDERLAGAEAQADGDEIAAVAPAPPARLSREKLRQLVIDFAVPITAAGHWPVRRMQTLAAVAGMSADQLRDGVSRRCAALGQAGDPRLIANHTLVQMRQAVWTVAKVADHGELLRAMRALSPDDDGSGKRGGPGGRGGREDHSGRGGLGGRGGRSDADGVGGR